MPQEMIQDPDFTPEIGKPQLIAWPVYPQFPAQLKGPSGASHTYTAPGKWARFIPVK
jgi:hypothetical protein